MTMTWGKVKSDIQKKKEDLPVVSSKEKNKIKAKVRKKQVQHG